MIFDYTLTALCLTTSLLSLVALKLTLPSIVRQYSIPQPEDNDELSYLDTVKFLLKRLTLAQTFTIKKAFHKLTHLFSLGIIILLSCVLPSTVYWGWSIGTLVSTGIYLIVELTMEKRNSSHENTYWKKTLVYSIMSGVIVSCCLSATAITRFQNINSIQFVKSLIVSVGIDEIFGRPILILLFSLILQDSQKMKRLISRYEFIQSNNFQIAALEQPSNQNIIATIEQVKQIDQRSPLQQIINQDLRKPTLPNYNKIQKPYPQIINDEADTKRQIKIRSKLKLPPVTIQSQKKEEDKSRKYGKENSQRQKIIYIGSSRITQSRNSKQQLLQNNDQHKRNKRIKRQQRQQKYHQQSIQKQKQEQISDDIKNLQVQNCVNVNSYANVNELEREQHRQNIQKQQNVDQFLNKDTLVYYFSNQNDHNKNRNYEQKQKEESDQDLTFKEQFIGTNSEQFVQLIKNLNEEDKYMSPHKDSSQTRNQFLPQGSSILPANNRNFIGGLGSHTQSVMVKAASNMLGSHLDSIQSAYVQGANVNIEKENNYSDGQAYKCSIYSKASKKLNIHQQSIQDDINHKHQDKQIQNESPQKQKKKRNYSINLSKHLEIIDAHQQQFIDQITPKKNRSNSQDPSKPIKAHKKIPHNNSETSGLKKSILQIKQLNGQAQQLQQISLTPIQGLIQKKPAKKVHKRKNYKLLFKGDSPYLQYLPNLLNKQLKNQFSDKKQKQNAELHSDRQTRNMATISHTTNIRQF